VAALFLRLGTTAFGGPAAHIAMMENEIVRRRQWLAREEFLDLLGMVNLVPGPSSTELAIFLGYRRAGWRGLLLGGVCFILPAALIVTAIAVAYVRFGKLPQVSALLYGIKPVIIAIVLQALWNLGRTAIKPPLSAAAGTGGSAAGAPQPPAKTLLLAVVGVAATVAGVCGVNPLLILISAGCLVVLSRVPSHRSGMVPGIAPIFCLATPAGMAASVAAAPGLIVPFSVWKLFLLFLKIGSVLFGSGYVLLAFLHADFVNRLHWLTENQLLDAVAVGQFTPGPVFTTATFIGYILGGPLAALVATVGIFLPSFMLVAISGPIVPRLQKSLTARAFLDGVNVASLALMAAVTWQLGRAALVDWLTATLAVVAAVLLLKYKVNSVWLVLGGAAAGWLMRTLL
jgi:chromate transporter